MNLKARKVESEIELMGEWVNEWMGEWVNEWMGEWVNELMGEWVNELMGEWVNEWMGEWVNELMGEWVNELMGDWLNELMGDWVNEWMGEWVRLKKILNKCKFLFWKRENIKKSISAKKLILLRICLPRITDWELNTRWMGRRLLKERIDCLCIRVMKRIINWKSPRMNERMNERVKESLGGWVDHAWKCSHRNMRFKKVKIRN